VSFVWLAAACASQPPRRPAALDPANPVAPESPALALTPIEPGPAPSEPAQPAATPAPAAHAPYTCPMHPEVVSATPGRCPKCGMELVAQAPDGGGSP
jgi:hypothetical protein